MAGSRSAAPANAEWEQEEFLLAMKGYSSADVARMVRPTPSISVPFSVVGGRTTGSRA
jgi:hypothetical protein